MTDEQMRAAILAYIQNDAQLLNLIRLSVTRSISQMASDQLSAIIAALNIGI